MLCGLSKIAMCFEFPTTYLVWCLVSRLIWRNCRNALPCFNFSGFSGLVDSRDLIHIRWRINLGSWIWKNVFSIKGQGAILFIIYIIQKYIFSSFLIIVPCWEKTKLNIVGRSLFKPVFSFIRKDIIHLFKNVVDGNSWSAWAEVLARFVTRTESVTELCGQFSSSLYGKKFNVKGLKPPSFIDTQNDSSKSSKDEKWKRAIKLISKIIQFRGTV